MTRLASELLVGAMLRRVNDAGGFGVVRAKGEATGGGILILTGEGSGAVALERGLGPTGEPALIESRPADSIEDYWQRRRSRDPDLWVIELDIPQVKRLVAETLGVD